MTVSAFDPLQIGPITLRNRFIKAATNEGKCKGGVISRGLADFHADIARGGAAMCTVAYCATSLDGRTFVDQATLCEDNKPDLRALTDAVHAEGAAICAQVTHAGCFTFLPKDELSTRSPMSASGGFNKVGVLSRRFTKRRMNRAQMTAMVEEFVTACELARDCGFDSVELHMGHGYLLSQFISPLYNRRRDAYGGSIDRRLAFPLEVLSRVLDAVGSKMAVIVKYSVTDAARGGNGIEEGVEIARQLEAAGAHMAVLSNGMNVESVSGIFGSSLPSEVRKPPENPIIRLGMKLQNISDFTPVEFSEMYQLENARRVRAAVSMPLCYIGGIQTGANVQTALDEGFEAVALGRTLVFDPNFVSNLAEDANVESGCTACNHCVTMMYTPGGTSCVLKQGDATGERNLIPARAAEAVT